jgi:GNAT superfamily N-acetyltransferase
MQVRQVRADEALAIRALRLRALADAPTAFEMTFQEEEQAPAEHWVEWARRGAAGKMSVTFVAVAGAEWCGMAGGFLRRDGAQLDATLFGMWVEPCQRERGAARQLVEAVVGWARSRGAQRLQLWVTEGNLPARMLYLHTGFIDTGQSQALASRPSLREELMIRAL